MPVTLKNDIACIRGALKSVLKDAYDNDFEANRIITKIDSQTGKNGDPPNVTRWNRECLKIDLENELFNCEYIEVDICDNFSKLNVNPVDNEKSFGILFWKGAPGTNNPNARDRAHATRLVNSVNDTTVKLLDTTKPGGEIQDHDRDELFNASPMGFTFLRMEKKS